jgi:hypothetical protein
MMGDCVFRILDPIQKMAATRSIRPRLLKGIHVYITVSHGFVDRLK